MAKADHIWMDGELVPWDEATIHVLTHTFHYGSGVFEGIRCYKTEDGPVIFRFDDHIDRLFHSASLLRMEPPFTKEEIREACLELIKRNGLEQCYLRPVFFHASPGLGVGGFDVPVRAVIIAIPWESYHGGDAREKGVSVMLSSYRRHHTPFTTGKITGAYHLSMVAQREAKAEGYDECLLLDEEGNVAEGGAQNVFLRRGDTILTPKEGAILPGFTRDAVMRIASDLGYEVKEADIPLEEFREAEEAFFVGTATEVVPIRELDGGALGDESFSATRKIQERLSPILRGKDEKYEHWVTRL